MTQNNLKISDLKREIRLNGDSLDPKIFNETALSAAKLVGKSSTKYNKPTQIRKFYDELLRLEQLVSIDDPNSTDCTNSLRTQLPLIRMLNAKAAYALGRDLVDKNFVELLKHCLSEIDPDNPKSLRNCCLFFESFLGFYKLIRPTDHKKRDFPCI